MKNLTKIFMMVVAGMFAFSCVTDTTNDINPELGLGDVKGETSLTVSLEESRTHLGEKVGNLYKLLWSENDVITINGVASTGITIMEDNPSAAKFTFAEPGVTRPFCVVYSAPSAAVAEEGSEGETGESEPETPAATTVYPVTFLATQSWVNGTFCEGAAPMYGYGEAVAEGEDVPAIELQHLVGVLRIAPKGNVTLTKLDVVAQTGTIAGDYTVDCTNGALTPVANTSNKVTVDFGTGLELNAETETPIYVTVPAGSYGTFLVTLHTATDKMTVKFNSDVKPIAVGKVREFTPFTYEANELDSEGDYLIDSEDALVKFAKGASSFYPHTTAKVVADLNMSNISAEDMKYFPIEGFGAYTFDGGRNEGYTISNLTTPLFGSTAATIQNVELTNVNITVTDLIKSGAIVCELYGGQLLNCKATGKTELNNTTFNTSGFPNSYGTIVHGGLAGYVSEAVVTGCTNDIDITITSLSASSSYKGSVGGVVGGATNGCSFSKLQNDGDLSFECPSQKSNLYISGVIGKNDDTAQNAFKLLSECTNNGSISTSADSKNTADIVMAGITGRFESDEEMTCDKLVNNGTITHNGEAAGLSLAGLVCYKTDVPNASFTNCSNTKELKIAEEAVAKASRIGGLFSNSVVAKSFNNCDNSGAITLGKASITSIVLGGLVAGSSTISDSISNCDNSSTGAVSIANGATVTSINMSGLFAGAITTESISTCSNSGDISLGKNAAGGTSAYLGGMATGNIVLDSITGYTNSGDISIADGATITSAYMSGMSASESMIVNKSMSNCDNTGSISIGDDITTLTGKVVMSGVANTVSAQTTPTITGCDNSGPISIGNAVHNTTGESNGTRLLIGGVFQSLNAGTVSQCYNNEGGTIEVRTGNWKSRYMVGGLFGYIGQTGNIENQVITITNCENKAAITVAPVGEINSASLGGLCAEAYAAADDSIDDVTLTNVNNRGSFTLSGVYLTNNVRIGGLFGVVNIPPFTLKECENSGVLTVAKVSDTQNSTIPQLSLGGLVGADTNKGTFNIIDCENSGNININSAVTNHRVAGIIGSRDVDKPTTISGTSNTGNITLTADQAGTGNNYVYGGILGYTNKANLEITNCTNGALDNSGNIDTTKGAITLGNAPGGSGVAGIAGYLSQVATISSCTNYGTITQDGGSATPRIGGIVGRMNTGSPAITGCVNKGALVNNGTVTESLNMGGLVGEHTPTGTLTVTGSTSSGTITANGSAPIVRLGGAVGYVVAGGVTIKDDSEHSGTITNNIVVGTRLGMGGLVGSFEAAEKTLTVTGSKNTGSVICAGAQTTATASTFAYCLGGMVGYSVGTVNISSCTNGVISEEKVIDTTKGIVTIGDAPTGVTVGGLVGLAMAAAEISTSYNYGHVSQTGKGGYNASYRAHIAGILGLGYGKGNVTITDCENHGMVEYGTVTPLHRVDVAGITATTEATLPENNKLAAGTYTITGCKNGGTIKFSAPMVQETNLAGMVGTPQGKTFITNCENLATAVIWSAATGSKANSVAGIIGGPSGAETEVVSCINRGTLKHTGTNNNNTNVGGICGYAYSIGKIDQCENYGQLEITGTYGGNIYAGGLIGYLRQTTKSVNTVVSNSVNRANLTFTGTTAVNYYGGGAFGYVKTDDNPKAELIIENVHNLGNLTYNCTYGTPYFGGIVGGIYNTTNISGCKCWCFVNIDAVDKFGWISGTARSDTAKVSNCEIGGGQEAFSEETEEMVSETLIKESNFHEYIYLNRDNTEADSCSALKSKPTIDVQTEAAN